MCNYKYEYKKHQLTGSHCIYSEFYDEYASEFPQTKSLPIDPDGYCIFHSKNKTWKIQNGFDAKFRELIQVTGEICKHEKPPKWPYNFSGFYFVQETGLLKLSDCPKTASLDFRFCGFMNGLTIESMQLKSIDLANTQFHEAFIVTDVKFNAGINASGAAFNNGIIVSNAVLEGYSYFDDCIFKNHNKKSANNFRFTDIITDYLDFGNSKFEAAVTLEKMSFNGEVSFDRASFLDEFYFHNNQIESEVSFKETEFLLSENVNPLYSTVDFQKLKIKKTGKLIFKGSQPFDNMVRGELNMNFGAPPEGLISFENFNLNKILLNTKLKLFELEKTGQVEIGQGCRKYYCQTDIFEIKTASPDQSLILDLVKTFCNYFETKNHYNLGIEIVERKPDIIRYFFFTDEMITKEEFESRIKRNEYDLWKTFSNLSEYAGNQLQPFLIEEKNKLIDLAAIFLKIQNRILAMDYQQGQLLQLIRSIAIDGVSIIEKEISLDKIVSANQSFYKQLPSLNPSQIVYNDNSIVITGSQNIVAPGTHGNVSSHFEINKEDIETKDLARQSLKWTKKQTIWTIIGVLVATLLSFLGLRLAGYI